MLHPSDTASNRSLHHPLAFSTELGSLAANVALHTRQSIELNEILYISVQDVRKVLDTDRVIIYQFGADYALGKVIVEDVVAPYQSILHQEFQDDCFKEKWYDTFATGAAMSNDDINTLVVSNCYLEMMQSWEVKANVVAPILQDYNLWGLFIIHHCRSQRNWLPEEVRLLQQLGIQLGIAIQQAELYQQLQERNQALEEANQQLEHILEREKNLSDLKSNFLSLTAHEFRTPMTTIRSSAELLENFDCGPEEKGLLFQQIHNAVDYMVNMLDDIRFMSRRPEEQKNLAPKPLNLPVMVEEICKRLRSLLNCKHQCDCFFTPPPEAIFLDEKLTAQILENLLSNAIKYSPKKTAIAVYMSLPNPSEICIEVVDDGMGIPEVDQPHVFETFYRAKNAAGMKGTGLGLAIVKRCVDLCGGSINLRSTLNQGTRVTVSLPLLRQT